MPTVLRISGYRFFFYSNEGDEPPHIHVVKAEHEAKFWLETLEMVWNSGFNQRWLNEVRRYLRDNQTMMVSAWREYFRGE